MFFLSLHIVDLLGSYISAIHFVQNQFYLIIENSQRTVNCAVGSADLSICVDLSFA